MNEWTNKQSNKQTNEQTKERTKEQTNKQTNEQSEYVVKPPWSVGFAGGKRIDVEGEGRERIEGDEAEGVRVQRRLRSTARCSTWSTRGMGRRRYTKWQRRAGRKIGRLLHMYNMGMNNVYVIVDISN